MSKQQAEKQARDNAAELSRIAMRLGRANPNQVDGLLVNADTCIKRYKAAKRQLRSVPVEKIEPNVQEDLELAMGSMTDVIKETVAPRAFALFVFTNGPDGNVISFTTNAKYGDLVQVLREFIDAAEAGGS